MTIVGKLLVFIVLLFCLVDLGLVLVVYMTRVNWQDLLKKEKTAHDADKANLLAYKQDRDNLYRQLQEGDSRWRYEHDRLVKLLEDEQELRKKQEETLNEEKKQKEALQAQNAVLVEEVKKRQKEVEQVRVALKDEIDKSVKLVKERNEMLEQKTAAEISSRTLLDINRRLEEQGQALARDNARMKANLGTTTTVSTTGKNPPPENIDGLIQKTDPSGLVTITLGSDSGLLRGHTMEVFRIDQQNPARSKYLGTLRIIEVSPKEAVAQPMGRLLGPIKPGDTVASRIMGG